MNWKTDKPFKTVYISHPLRGGMDPAHPDLSVIFGNRDKVDGICGRIVEANPEILPLSPLNAFSFLNVFTDDEKAIELDLKLLTLADELWVFGEWEKSAGCKIEIGRARELCIPIFYENGASEVPKRFYCAARIDPYLEEHPLVKAWDAVEAGKRLGCTPRCGTICGCDGPTEWDEERDDWESESDE
jgi:hypothetical protein